MTVSIHTADQHSPITAMMTNDSRHPYESAMKPTIGPASAPPSGVPALAQPTAVACWRRGNQLLTSLFAAEAYGPSPIPKITRTMSKDKKLNTAAVRPQNTDHTTEAIENTFFAPMRSEK